MRAIVPLRAPGAGLSGSVRVAMWPARALVLMIALASPRVAHPYCRMTAPRTPPGACEQGAPVAWRVASIAMHLNARDLAAEPAVGQPLDDLVRRSTLTAARLWSDAACGPSLALADDVDAALDLARDGRNVVSVNRRWAPDAYHRPGTVAFTVVTTDAPTGTLLEADVELNARAMENPLGYTFGDGAPSWGVADAPSVLLHELGHVAGLGHSRTAGAVMESSMDVERQRRALTDDDRAGLCALGARRAVTGGCAVTPGARASWQGALCLILIGASRAVHARRTSRRRRTAP